MKNHPIPDRQSNLIKKAGSRYGSVGIYPNDLIANGINISINGI
jgi:hypothetical protein